jgi:hypothetical protein
MALPQHGKYDAIIEAETTLLTQAEAHRDIADTSCQTE